MAMKQNIILRKDLNMRKGKMIAQGAHASQLAIMACKSSPLHTEWYETWMDSAFTKIALGVNSEEELLNIKTAAQDLDVPVALVTDNGTTEFHGVPTITALGIGPAPEELLRQITGHLSLL